MVYRNETITPDPRYEAETQVIQARAALLDEIRRGLRIANELAKVTENSESYKRRVEALTALYNRIYR